MRRSEGADRLREPTPLDLSGLEGPTGGPSRSSCPAAPYARNGCRYALFAWVCDNQFVRNVEPITSPCVRYRNHATPALAHSATPKPGTTTKNGRVPGLSDYPHGSLHTEPTPCPRSPACPVTYWVAGRPPWRSRRAVVGIPSPRVTAVTRGGSALPGTPATRGSLADRESRRDRQSRTLLHETPGCLCNVNDRSDAPIRPCLGCFCVDI
jgi:hypothetical protein